MTIVPTKWSAALNWFLGGALAASVVLHAHGGRAPTGDEPAALSCPIPLEELQLTVSQRERLVACCKTSCGDGEDLRASVARCRAELEAAIAEDSLDPARVRALGKQLAELRGRMVESCVDSVLLVRDVLSREQLDALKKCCGAH